MNQAPRMEILRDETSRAATEPAGPGSLSNSGALEVRFRSFFEGQGALVILVRAADGSIVDVNPAAVRFYGHPRETLLSMKLWEVDQGGEGKVREAIRSVQAGETSGQRSAHRLADGRVREMTVTSSLVEHGGEPLLLCILQDVTEATSSEDRVRREHENFLKVLSAAPVGLLLVDRHSVVTGTNAAMSRIVFREPSEVIGQRAGGGLGCVHSLEEPGGCGFASACVKCRLRAGIETVLASGERVTQREVALKLRIDGEDRERWLSVSVEPVEVDGEVSAIVAVDDVTERKRWELALAESRARFEDLVSRIPVGVYAFRVAPGGGMSFEYVSPRFCEILGLREEEALRDFRTVLRQVHPDDRNRLIQASLQVAGSHGAFRWESRFVVGGETRWIRLEADPIREAGDEVVWSGVVTDISERHQSEERIRRLAADLERRVEARTAELESATREMEAFAYSVSHDLRAPLRAIDGFSARLDASHGAALGEEARRLLGIVRTNARQMAVLIDELLALSRVGRTELKFEALEMTRIALEAGREALAESGGWPGIDFRVGALPDAWGSRALVHQVLRNLLSNAFKFSSKVERPVVEVLGEAGPDGVTYRVRDNGAGFDLAYRDKLFGVFQRLHTTAEFPGVGIGLALVHRIVTRHGGQVSADGEVGKGATFSFTLPAGPV